MARSQTTAKILLMLSIALVAAAHVQAADDKRVAFHYDVYPAMTCDGAADGAHDNYTLTECMEKCETRGCEAFMYTNGAAGDEDMSTPWGVCEIYIDCEREASDRAHTLFFP